MTKFIIKEEGSNLTSIVTENRLKEKFLKKKKEHDKFYWKTHNVGGSRWSYLTMIPLWMFLMHSSNNWTKHMAAIMLPIIVGVAVNEWQKYINRDKLKQRYESRDFAKEFTDELLH